MSSAPIIHLNGAPGVGKLTIGRLLAAHLKARLLDNHAIYDVALAVTDFRSACEPDEHRRRIVAEDRAAKRKAREPELVDRYVVRPLARLHGPHSLALDVTDLTADAAASHIADWTAKASAI